MGKNKNFMRVAKYYSNSNIQIEECPVPKIGEGEILIRIEASGICGSDLMEWYRLPKAPVVLGHEVAGEVVELGDSVENFKVGDRVVATHHVPCDNCNFCLTDRHTLCPSIKLTNFEPGGFSEFLRVPKINVEKGVLLLPESVTFEEGSFVEPLGCVVRGQRVAGFNPNMSVAIVGSGITGLLNLQYVLSQGAKNTFVLDINEFKLEKAKEFGAGFTLNVKDDPVSFLKEKNNNALADLVIVCTGSTLALNLASELVEKGGTILFFAPTDPEYMMNFNFNDFWWSGVKFVTSYAAAPDDMKQALKLISSSKVNVTDMISHKISLSEIQEGFRIMQESSDNLKVMVMPQK